MALAMALSLRPWWNSRLSSMSSAGVQWAPYRFGVAMGA